MSSDSDQLHAERERAGRQADHYARVAARLLHEDRLAEARQYARPLAECLCPGALAPRPRRSRHGDRRTGPAVTVRTSHEPLSLADLLPETVAEMGRRGSRPDFDCWVAEAKDCGFAGLPGYHTRPHPMTSQSLGRRNGGQG